MKNVLRTVIAASCTVLLSLASAYAFSFTDLKDFSGNGNLLGASYKTIERSNDDAPYKYEHSFLAPAGMILQSASLSITHIGNATTSFRFIFWDITNESNWDVSVENSLVGNLSQSPVSGGWVTDTFDLSGILNKITDTTPWALTVRLQNTTDWDDVLKLDKSVFSGTYASLEDINDDNGDSDPVPAPEPASMLLLGTGLMAGLGKIAFGKKA